jgi:hypothetical protein
MFARVTPATPGSTHGEGKQQVRRRTSMAAFPLLAWLCPSGPRSTAGG